MKGFLSSKSASTLVFLVGFVLVNAFIFGVLDTSSKYRKKELSGVGGPEMYFDDSGHVIPLSLAYFEPYTQNNEEFVPDSVTKDASVEGQSNPFPAEVLGAGINSEKEPYFILPAKGKNWGKLHPYNAVDIAGNCGVPIYASADGVVWSVSSDNSWNGGYGNFIVLNHSNGTRTKYAHTLKNFVEQGYMVSKGEQIALMGNSGNVSGDTGCHVHFEIYGAKNPFVK